MSGIEEKKSRKNNSGMPGFSLRGMLKMMRMMSKGFKSGKGSFDCSSMMKDMLSDENGKAFNCCSMMDEMMEDDPLDCSSMMDAMTGDMSDKPFDCCSRI